MPRAPPACWSPIRARRRLAPIVCTRSPRPASRKPGCHEPAGPSQGRIPERAARRYSSEPAGPSQGRIPERAARRYSSEPAGPSQGRGCPMSRIAQRAGTPVSARLAIARAVLGGAFGRNRGRLALSIAAIALGVALGFAVALINEAAIGEFTGGMKTLSGLADLEVRGPRAHWST